MLEYETEPSERVTQLESEPEKGAIDKLFDLRVGYSGPESGERLLRGAIAYFEENADSIKEFLDDSQ